MFATDGAKQLGQEANLAKLVAEASVICMPKVPSNFDVDNIRVTKVAKEKEISNKMKK